jgi:hypothetical protein
MSRANKAHTGPHKYERGTIGKNGHAIYKCMLPNCTHYLPHEFNAINLLSLCWGNCGAAVEMDRQFIREKIKHTLCNKCREARAKRRAELIAVGKDIEDD